LLWSANPHGKTIVKYNVLNILENAKMLFATRYHTDNIYVTRHIAADLREIGLFSGFNIKRYLKNIDVERLDIKKRLELNDSIVEYFSTIVHFNYISGYNSYGKIKTINEELKILGFPDIEIPNTEQDYLEDKIFDKIFEQVSIIFVMNHYEIFSEFLFDEDE